MDSTPVTLAVTFIQLVLIFEVHVLGSSFAITVTGLKKMKASVAKTPTFLQCIDFISCL